MYQKAGICCTPEAGLSAFFLVWLTYHSSRWSQVNFNAGEKLFTIDTKGTAALWQASAGKCMSSLALGFSPGTAFCRISASLIAVQTAQNLGGQEELALIDMLSVSVLQHIKPACSAHRLMPSSGKHTWTVVFRLFELAQTLHLPVTHICLRRSKLFANSFQFIRIAKTMLLAVW